MKPPLGDRLAVAVATGFYLSYIPVKLSGGRERWTGSGLIGTVEGLLLLPLLPHAGTASAVFLAAAIGASCWICGIAERVLKRHDDQRIILDEIVGFWTAAAFLPHTPRVLLAAFVLFRVLDAVKIPPVNLLARLPRGCGIVADDIGAGVIANLLVRGALSLGIGTA